MPYRNRQGGCLIPSAKSGTRRFGADPFAPASSAIGNYISVKPILIIEIILSEHKSLM
jgi:hypothetical protein